ncbi:hypothetical protein ABZ172_11945 [Streptomyces sp. NPDC006296]|uniref:hypothetical protein n=1 Tax=Streptomyces sp. NPDC006296 TaxID=3156746 RepID=UPI0033B26054
MERFMEKVAIDEKTGCWLWTASVITGYGAFRVDGRMVMAHRWSLEQKLGRKLGPEEVARHMCHTRLCVSPACLEPGSKADNMRDEVARRGPRPKLHDDCDHPDTVYQRRKCPKTQRRRFPSHGLTDIERFALRVDTSAGPDACHLWTGSKNENGYGRFRAEGKFHTATRWLMGHLRGKELTPDEVVLHSCDVTSCLNRRHLRVGTQAENMREKVERGRHRNGSTRKEACGRGHKFTPENTRLDKKGHQHCRACKRRRRPTPAKQAA